MAIIPHPTRMFRREHCQVVECDLCRRQANFMGHDPGEAAVQARKEGFQTIRDPKSEPGAPLIWWCGRCP